jgi:DNA-binding MarR family transcriptional regulator
MTAVASVDRRSADHEAALRLLPDATAHAGEYRTLAGDASGSDLLDAAADVRRAALSEILHRRNETQDPAMQAALLDVARVLQTSLAASRVAARREAVAERLSTAEPLRRRILDALTLGPLGPSELARYLGTDPETVVRIGNALEAEGLMAREQHPHDGRRKLYVLQDAGAREAAEDVTFGAPEPAPAITREIAIAAIERGLLEAVELRRRENRLDDAAGQLEIVIREATRHELQWLELKARRELTTTLRQASSPALKEQMNELKRIARGRDERFSGALAVPAEAHLLYERGRRTDVLLVRRMRSLSTAAGLYGALADAKMPGDDWKARRAWALYSMAAHYRQHSKLGDALKLSDVAARLFEGKGDAYGFANCLFLAGFSLRLRGDFHAAHAALDEARRMAHDDGFERLTANAMLQLGEARRCEGGLEEATDLLTEALGRARKLEAVVTQAFAMSALGATAFCQDDPLRGLTLLEQADQLFREVNHRDGVALNLRRQAVVRRTIMDVGRRSEPDEVRRLLALAKERYERLDSPAGVVACLIETGQLRRDRRLGVADTCRQLLTVLADWNFRDMLARDPWIPDLLLAFARTAGDADLLSRAQEIQSDAHDRHKARGTRGWAFLAAHIGGVGGILRRAPAGDEPSLDERLREMASEPRRNTDLAAVLV